VFNNFDPEKVARYSERKIQTLVSNPEIIRNRMKIEAAVRNARAFLKVQEEFGNFDSYCWHISSADSPSSTAGKLRDRFQRLRRNHRLVAFQNDRVSFRWKDYAHGGKQKIMTVSADEFLRRFLVHVLPKGLVRIRHFGLLANRRRGSMLVRCRALCGAEGCGTHPEITPQLRCPVCTGPMLVLERITSSQLYFRSRLLLPNLPRNAVDSS
jgi:methyladenine glycosylase/putative transposase